MTDQFIHFFGGGEAAGDPDRKDILGGKGAALAAMSRAGLPVPPGFTIATRCCRHFLENARWPDGLEDELRRNMARLEALTGRKYGDPQVPLLVSVRSGAAVSMPGMMDTILNCGLSPIMAGRAAEPLAFWRTYCQFARMFVTAATGEPTEAKCRIPTSPTLPSASLSVPHPAFHSASVEDWQALASEYHRLYEARTGRSFPHDPWQALRECIETVFRSWQSPRAVAYRHTHGIRGLDGTAATVQAMFPSEVSGIVFTRHPDRPDADEMLVESSYGLGEAVVSGEVCPDSFVLDRHMLTVRRRVLGKKTEMVFALGSNPIYDADAPSLTDQQLRELADLALKVERFFGYPVDVEWGWAQGQFALLQARPIRTGLAEKQSQLLRQAQAHLQALSASGHGPWVLHNLAETLPHPTPLTWSVQRRFMSGSGGLGEMYRAVGFAPSPLAESEGFLTLILGRIYMDAALAGEMFFPRYPFRYDQDLLRCDPAAAQSPPTVPHGPWWRRISIARRLAAIYARLRVLARDFDRTFTADIIPPFVEWCRRERQRSLSSLTNEELAALWHERQRRVLDEFAPRSLLPAMLGALALADLKNFLAEHFWADEQDPDELAALLAVPETPDKTVEANGKLWAVGLGKLTLAEWLEQFGHRGPEEMELAMPRWHQRPDELHAMAAACVGCSSEDRASDAPALPNRDDPLAIHQARLAKSAESLTRLCGRLPAGLGRQLADRASLASRYLRLREDGKYYLMLGYELLRQVALEVGRRLGIGEDVFFFTAEEMLAALRASPHIASGPLVSPLSAGQPPEGPTPPLPLPRANPSAAEQVCQQASERRGQQITEHVLAERKAAYHAEIRIPLPRFIDAAALETLGQPPPAPTGQQYRGFPLSPGAALGPARIVRSPAEAGRLGRRYVLVCHSTDPAWTPLFAHAAALVIECGGALSHGAIVAREMGLPAVVLPEATTIFTEGESLVVDGSTGLITRGTSGTVTANSLPSADDVRIAWRQLPPPPGPGERRGAKVRNLCLLCWGVYLLAALLLPTPWLYEPSLRTLDAVLWPVLRMLGKQGVVISAAAGLAAMTMLGQRLLSDNRRLREAKRRAAALVREANQLPPHAPRRRTLLAAAATVNARLFGAAMLPLAILLGPMVLMFLWFPARVDPASWNAPPGASVDVVAMIDGEFTGPVTLELTDPLRLDETTPAAQCLPPVATVLREMLAGEHKLPELPGWTPEQLRADLAEYLAAGVPPQSLAWKLHVPPTAEGRFAVSLRAGNQRPLRLFVVLGERYPPEPAERFSSAAGPVRSAKIIYPPPDERRVFWAPLGGLGLAEWDAGWLTLYLVVYLPAMLLFRWMLRIA